MRKIFPIFAILLGAFWIQQAFGYGLWVRRGPGGGFFPLIGGAMTLLFGLFYLIGDFKNPLPASIDKKFIYPILAVLTLLFSSYLIGLLPGLLFFVLFWLWLYEKFTFRFSGIVAACTVGGLWAVFVFWLSVPLPKGLIHQVIFG